MFLGVFAGVENVSLTLVFDAAVECSDVLFFVGKSKYAGFSLSMETVSCLPFATIVKYLGFLSTTWKGPI